MTEKLLRKQLADCLDWKSAHVGFDDVVKGIPVKLRGAVPTGFEHSIWQLVEHIRLAQHDILDFSRNPAYEEMKWPDDYWPVSPVPKGPAAWNRSLAAYRSDRRAMQRLVVNPRIDLLKKIPHGSGQTVLRELLLVADHTAYHVAQILDVRRALGIWH
jgi:DinB family protein